MIRKEFWIVPRFISGTEDFITSGDYDGRYFCYDVIEMALVDDNNDNDRFFKIQTIWLRPDSNGETEELFKAAQDQSVYSYAKLSNYQI